MQRYKKLLIALAAIASIYLVRATGLDAGLIDAALEAAVEAVTFESEAQPPAEVVVPDAPSAELQAEQADTAELEAAK